MFGVPVYLGWRRRRLRKRRRKRRTRGGVEALKAGRVAGGEAPIYEADTWLYRVGVYGLKIRDRG